MAVLHFQSTFHIAVLIAALYCFPLIIMLLAFSEGDNYFDKPAGGQEFYRYNRHTRLALGSEGVNLFTAREELARRGVDGSGPYLAPFVEFHAKAGIIKP